MKKLVLLSVSLFAAALMGVSTARAITIDATASQPTVGADDASSYVTDNGDYNGGYDYSNNWSNGQGAPGQTFTATTTGDLTAIVLEGSGGAGLGYQSGTFALNVYSVGIDGTTLTYLGGSEDYTFANQNTDSTMGTITDYSTDYLTFNLPSSISLTAGAVYAFDFSGPAYYGLSGSDFNDVYSGGEAITTNGNPSSAATAINGTTTYDRNFDAQITVPEPSTWAMLAGGLVILVAWQRRRALR